MLNPDYGTDLIMQAKEFIASLDENHEPIITVSGIVVDSVSLTESGLIIFYGTHDGSPARVIQSCTNVNMTLCSAVVPDGQKPKKINFGFHPTIKENNDSE